MKHLVDDFFFVLCAFNAFLSILLSFKKVKDVRRIEKRKKIYVDFIFTVYIFVTIKSVNSDGKEGKVMSF